MYEAVLLLIGIAVGGLAGTVILWPMYRDAVLRRDDVERTLGKVQRDVALTSAHYRDEQAAHAATKALLDASQVNLESAQEALKEAARTVVDMAKPADSDPPAGG